MLNKKLEEEMLKRVNNTVLIQNSRELYNVCFCKTLQIYRQHQIKEISVIHTLAVAEDSGRVHVWSSRPIRSMKKQLFFDLSMTQAQNLQVTLIVEVR